jgi:hypothetical protein
MSGVDQVDRAVYQSPENGIAEAVCYPKSGETVTLRGGYGEATVARVDRRRHFPVILDDAPFPAVPKRTIVEYSQRVENAE